MISAASRIVTSWRKEKQHLIVNPVLSGKDMKSGHYVRVLAIKEYPPVIMAGYLDQLDAIVKKEGATLRKTIRYGAADIVWNSGMKYKLRRLERSIHAGTTEDPTRKAESSAYQTILALRDSKNNDDRKLVDVWTFLTIAAPKLHQLDVAQANLTSWFDDMSGLLLDLRREQLEAMRQTGPVYDPITPNGQFFAKHHYGRATTDSIAARTYPMTRGSFSDGKGLYMGRRTEDGSFCFVNLCDPNDSRAQNLTVFGKTGEGKSFLMKALVGSLLEEGVHVFVFDLTGEWRALCEEVEGVYIDHTADNGRYFEPLTIMPPLPEKDQDCIMYNRGRLYQAIQSGLRTASLLADGLTKGELFEAGEAIRQVYEEAGIDRDKQETWDPPYVTGKKPTIHRFFDVLLQRKAGDYPNCNKTHVASLIEKLQLYFIGIYDGIFRHEEPLTFHRAPLVVYKVGIGTNDANEKDERAKQSQLKMSMAFDMVNANIQMLKYEGITFSAVLVDEGQRQFKNVELRSAIFAWYTTIRQWNGMMILGANTPAILLDNSEGVGCWENTSVRIYFFLETSAIRSLASHSEVPAEIQERIAGNEGSRQYILEYHKRYDELWMDVPEEEQKLYKTRGLKEG